LVLGHPAWSECCSDLGSLPNRMLRVEFRGNVCAANKMQAPATGRVQGLVGISDGPLPGADHHVIDVQHSALAIHGDVQAGVVDPVVLDPFTR
jgi:hypothetical protein